jgi:hypothetical protein
MLFITHPNLAEKLTTYDGRELTGLLWKIFEKEKEKKTKLN